jgi:hypothetical protein
MQQSESEQRDRTGICFTKKGDFVSRAIAGEMVVVPVKGQVGDLDAIYNMNEVGAFIWNRIDGRSTVRQIVEAVGAEFEAASVDVEEDALQFIAALQAAGLVEPGGAGG